MPFWIVDCFHSKSEGYVNFKFPDEIQEYSLSQFLIRQLVEFAGSRSFAPSSMKFLEVLGRLAD